MTQQERDNLHAKWLLSGRKLNIQYIDPCYKNDTWQDITKPGWCSTFDYREKPEPKPKKRVPLERDDWKGVWFVRSGSLSLGWNLVTGVWDRGGISIGGYPGSNVGYPDLLAAQCMTMERSRDCENWEPCWKEVEA